MQLCMHAYMLNENMDVSQTKPKYVNTHYFTPESLNLQLEEVLLRSQRLLCVKLQKCPQR